MGWINTRYNKLETISILVIKSLFPPPISILKVLSSKRKNENEYDLLLSNSEYITFLIQKWVSFFEISNKIKKLWKRTVQQTA